MRRAVALVLIVLLVAAGYLGYRQWTEKYSVSKDDGRALAQVVTASMAKTGQLRVSTLSGTVQGVGEDVRWGGLLRSDRVMKVPYSVDYFVDLSKVGTGDMMWKADTRTLTVRIPPVFWGRPDIQEDRATLVRDRGVLITHAATLELARQASTGAQSAAGKEAARPKWIAEARQSAKEQVARLLTAAITASGKASTVRVLFDDEARNDEVWDMSVPVAGVNYNGY